MFRHNGEPFTWEHHPEKELGKARKADCCEFLFEQSSQHYGIPALARLWGILEKAMVTRSHFYSLSL